MKKLREEEQAKRTDEEHNNADKNEDAREILRHIHDLHGYDKIVEKTVGLGKPSGELVVIGSQLADLLMLGGFNDLETMLVASSMQLYTLEGIMNDRMPAVLARFLGDPNHGGLGAVRLDADRITKEQLDALKTLGVPVPDQVIEKVEKKEEEKKKEPLPKEGAW